MEGHDHEAQLVDLTIDVGTKCGDGQEDGDTAVGSTEAEPAAACHYLWQKALLATRAMAASTARYMF